MELLHGGWRRDFSDYYSAAIQYDPLGTELSIPEFASRDAEFQYLPLNPSWNEIRLNPPVAVLSWYRAQLRAALLSC
jgi:hypothetical protein